MLHFINKLFSRTQEEKKQKILIFCGAGISAESGLSTFRDSDGLWNSYDPLEICNLKTFTNNKALVFEFYNQRKKEILHAKPNLAHFSVANIQKKYGIDNVHIFTSNIDNLLDKAGCKNVTYIHGNCQNMQCLECKNHWFIGDEFYDIKAICPQCSSDNIKPHIVFFNEEAPKYKELRQAFESSGEVIYNDIVPNIKLIVGTSFKVIKTSAFYPTRGKSILVDLNPIEISHKEFNVIINKSATLGLIKAEKIINNWYDKKS